MQTEKCTKIHESSRNRPDPYQQMSELLCQRENDHIIKRLSRSVHAYITCPWQFLVTTP